ncbi:hypothetical protein BD413DRAFT_95555 [Trametes elegans]|nr:hypothetical protein BD413DRAFT_95555 [Trametes elegans]
MAVAVGSRVLHSQHDIQPSLLVDRTQPVLSPQAAIPRSSLRGRITVCMSPMPESRICNSPPVRTRLQAVSHAGPRPLSTVLHGVKMILFFKTAQREMLVVLFQMSPPRLAALLLIRRICRNQHVTTAGIWTRAFSSVTSGKQQCVATNSRLRPLCLVFVCDARPLIPQRFRD